MPIYFRTLGRYFDEISQDTGKFCFGVDDTLKVHKLTKQLAVCFLSLRVHTFAKYFKILIYIYQIGARNGCCGYLNSLGKLRDSEICTKESRIRW